MGVTFSTPAFGETQSDFSMLVGEPVDSGQEIRPAHVLSRIELFRKDLDDIRFEMGRPETIAIEMVVLNAAPHEVFFQARSLYRKADRLVVEVAGEESVPLRIATPLHIQPVHVLAVVNAALARLGYLKKRLGITLMNSERLPNPSATPSHVFFSIGLANQQLNVLVNQHFSPRDVFGQVSLALLYTQRLLQQFPQATRHFPPPPLERGRRPGDVYMHLIDCHLVLSKIAKHSKLQILKLSLKNPDTTTIQPNEVYDIASLVVSELAHLFANKRSNVDPPQKPTPPGLTLPSHVYQQVGSLLLHLKELEGRVKLNPQWLQS